MFQCDCQNIRQGDETIHMLSHYVGRTEDKIRDYMRTFAEKHKDWAHQDGCNILSKKKLQLQDYLETVLLPGVPWDKLALLILAQMYEIHIFFLTGPNKFW